MVQEKDVIGTASLAVPAKHNPATEETLDCVHPESVRAEYGHKICDRMTATPSESKPGGKKQQTKLNNYQYV